MTYQVVAEEKDSLSWYMEFAEDLMPLINNWFIESDEHGILSACSPWRPCDNPIQ